MEPDELILSEVHMESCPPGQRAWVTQFHCVSDSRHLISEALQRAEAQQAWPMNSMHAFYSKILKHSTDSKPCLEDCRHT